MYESSLLRFITAGSVDDGKSTLIGRILYDAKALLSDQIQQLHDKANREGHAAHLDLASLTDGLAAEREQGITIDVAYRYFTTPKRKFIIADAPGHEQYTRNMVTGASTADAAIVLIDSTRVFDANGKVSLLAQTKRHSIMLQLLGCQHIIVAVNKMDLVGYEASIFQAIAEAYEAFAAQRDMRDIRFIPIAALQGDNIVECSEKMPWYQGDPLLTMLENLPLVSKREKNTNKRGLLLPIQRVARQHGSNDNTFRAYQGKIEAGHLHIGQTVRVLPSAATATVVEIEGLRGSQKQAGSGEVVSFCLNRAIDISRGCYVVSAASLYQPSRQLSASLCWLDQAPLNPRRKYWLKHTTQTVGARIERIEYVFNRHDLLSQEGDKEGLAMNDIGCVSLRLQGPIVPQHYRDNHAAGAFILIDDVSHHTVAAGMITGFSADASYAHQI